MPTPVKMPRLGESVAEGTIGSWLKQVGDMIERDEAIAEVITDKINAELPSPVAGRLVKILVQVDETVPVGTDIAVIEESADVAAGSSSSTAGPDAAPVKSVSEAATPLPDSQPAAAHGNDVQEKVQREDEERQRISPLARRLAQEHGINLNDIAGTGAGGRVRKEDILAFVAQRQKVATPATSYTPAASAVSAPVAQQPVRMEAPQPTAAELTEAGDEVISPSRMRLAIAEHMVRSKRTSPHATTVVEVDMTNIAKWLAKNKEEFKRREGYGISFVPFVMKAVCEGIRKFPIINSTWTPDDKIIIKRHINLGMAVSTDTGLVVPTIYDADQYTLAALARQVNALAQRARANKLTVQDMQNSTFVVNNPGVFGTIISMPIINQPHAAILSMDAVVKRPVVIEDDAIAVRSMMFISMSFDHRILDGAGAGGFLQAVRTKLQSYGRDIDVY
ncbi:dihydrolipoamide acetyltransferase family protein [Dictyobacter formicarum]|uniref:Dihydrolipoamide acetyltransferase component of pyruvate dehydrogenase complex n=1 Tax=Dictyobacter formicarum TaxID=2778368 RepID=A0ABQ3VEP1_9CHLR|nr:dihydrolipoamide acetyltransferase family protein [Dictyobacter formicarum]GHO84632.1 dihydrolipoamide acetyltransferase component of pyruvate dehydrogenase complex [Dictyobacter formicarum]